MFSRLFTYLYRGHSAKKREQVPEWTVELLATANANLVLQLERANSKIRNLKVRFAESDLLLAHAQTRVGDCSYAALPLDDDVLEISGSSVGPKAAQRFNWIDNIWVCTGQEYLKNAEEAWKGGDIESARITLETSLTTSSYLSVSEALHSRVLLAAILHAIGKYHESLFQLDCVMNNSSTRSEVQRFRYKNIVSTAYFIEAMNFMAMDSFERAYWSFSRSLPLPEYRDTAREYQIKAIVGFTQQQSCDDGASDNLPLRPVISLDGTCPESSRH